MTENRGPLGFPRLTDRGPFVTHKNLPFQEVRDRGFDIDFYWMEYLNPDKFFIRLNDFYEGSYEYNYEYYIGSFQQLNPNREFYRPYVEMDEIKRMEPNFDRQFIYRGMDWYEMESIKNRGYIASKYTHNIGELEHGVTFFTNDILTAFIYASTFAPWYHKPTVEKSGYIVKVIRENQNVKINRGDHEIGVTGNVPIHDIVKIYEIPVLEEYRPLRLELRIDKWRKELREGTRMGPDVMYGYRGIDPWLILG